MTDVDGMILCLMGLGVVVVFVYIVSQAFNQFHPKEKKELTTNELLEKQNKILTRVAICGGLIILSFLLRSMFK